MPVLFPQGSSIADPTQPFKSDVMRGWPNITQESLAFLDVRVDVIRVIVDQARADVGANRARK